MTAKRVDFGIKEKMVSLAGACFWYWNSFYSFLDSCGVSRSVQNRFPKESYSKYQVMRNVLTYLEERGDTETIESMVANIYRLKNAVDKEALDEAKAKSLLAEFRAAVGDDPIENEVRKIERTRRLQKAQKRVEEQRNFQDRLGELNKEFAALFSLKDVTPQERGYKLEKQF